MCAKLLVKTKIKCAMRGMSKMLDFCLDHLKQTFSFKKSLVRSL